MTQIYTSIFLNKGVYGPSRSAGLAGPKVLGPARLSKPKRAEFR